MPMNLDEYLSSNNGGADEATTDLSAVMSKINAEQTPEPELEPKPDETPKPEPEKEVKTDPEPTPKPEETPKPDPEAERQAAINAQNAERRRQREENIARKAVENSTEYQLVKQLAEMSGKTVEQLQQDIRNAKIAAELQQAGVPEEQIEAAVPRIAQERIRADEAQRQLEAEKQNTTQAQFEQWVTRIEAEKAQALASHPYLTQEDISQAQDYMLNTLQNPHIPFAQVVQAVHGQKILEGQKAAMRTELLAEMSGRSTTPLPPQGTPAPQGETLTADEKFIAKAMRISEAEYLKWKSNPS